MNLRFGIFLAPFHRAGENPTLSLRRDIDLISRLDELGYDEAWVGEHHSGGWEVIASPELFLAAVGERTTRIKLGTGVVSLPYHNPFHVADRIVLLDHLTRGRAMLGVGPGALPGDARFLGLEPTRQREMMDESLGIIIRLLTEDEPINYETDWFQLHEAQLQLKPYQRPTMPIAVATTVSPAGVTAAGKHGVGVLSIASYTEAGIASVKTHWGLAEKAAQEHDKPAPDREAWRLVVPFHLSESREQAIQDIDDGIMHWYNDYLIHSLGAPGRTPVESGRQLAEAMNAFGGAIVGTPDEAIESIYKLQEISGGFGCLLGLANEWTTREKMYHSYELMARHVMPEFQDTISWVKRSNDWSMRNKEELMAGTQAAIMKAIKEQGGEFVPPATPG
ncbi:MAG: LLM class flavin-dependent oxidoreductase [Dehalococcoidia bacterium]